MAPIRRSRVVNGPLVKPPEPGRFGDLARMTVLGLLLAVLYLPPLQDAFHTEGMGPREWLAVGGLSFVPLLVIEGMKVSPWRLRQ